MFPHAPRRPVTVNNGMVMRAWYDVSIAGGQRQEDEPGVRESERQVAALVEREGKRGVPAAATSSSGSRRAGRWRCPPALRYPSGWVASRRCRALCRWPTRSRAEAEPTNRDVPIFMAHGTHDPMIPLVAAAEARDHLIALDYRAEWHEYLMPHSVSAEEIADLSAWLRGTFARWPAGRPL